MSDFSPSYRPLIVAHRGFSAFAPENTLAAFSAALEARADACECDLRLTKDHRLVVIHDETVDRTTSGSGRVADFTLEELQAFDAGAWKGDQFKGERVPAFEELLSLAKGKCRLFVELKEPATVEPAIDLVRRYDCQDQVTFIAFDFDVCRLLRQRAPEIPVGFLFVPEHHSREANFELIQRALEAHLSGLDLHYAGLTPELHRFARERMLPVWAWTVDEPAQLRALAAAGVDGITTNDCALALKVLQQAP